MAKTPAIIEQRPAYLVKYEAQIAEADREFHVDAGKAIGLISIKNGNWTARISGESVPFMDGEYPARYIDMAFVRSNENTSKTYYADPFNEETPAPPDCASADGITPDAGVPDRQNDFCATCQWNAWRSDPSGSGKGKRCKDNKRAAMLPEGDFENEDYNGPVLLRIPPASLTNFAMYQKEQHAAGRSLLTIMTRLSFDPKASGQVIQFAFSRWLTEEEMDRIVEWRTDEHVERMLSIDEDKAKAVEDGDGEEAATAPAKPTPRPPQRAAAAETVAATKAAPKPAPKPAAKPVITPAPAAQTREQRVAEMRAEVARMKAAKAPPPPPAPTEEELAEAELAAEEAALAAELAGLEPAVAPPAKPNGRGRKLAVVAPEPPPADEDAGEVSDDDTLDALDRLAADL